MSAFPLTWAVPVLPTMAKLDWLKPWNAVAAVPLRVTPVSPSTMGPRVPSGRLTWARTTGSTTRTTLAGSVPAMGTSVGLPGFRTWATTWGW